MAETLQVILSSPTNFLGTLALILTIGIAGCMLLSPFKGPRHVHFVDFGEEDED